jgi:hypothetical protein
VSVLNPTAEATLPRHLQPEVLGSQRLVVKAVLDPGAAGTVRLRRSRS